MRDPKRIHKILGALRAVWDCNPDMRLGQLLLNLTRGSQMEDDIIQIWHAEDEEWLKQMERYLITGSFV